ncbi:MAG: TSUP family transporter [Aliifodinibius sp.]|nr:TSUP family transporter [Fodinibius sp.]
MDFPLNLAEYFLSLAIITAGSLLQGSVGFGLGLLGVPLLILIEPTLVPGPLLLMAFFLNILVSRREWRDMDLKSIKWVLVGRVLGTVIAAAIMTILARNTLSLLLGFLVLLAVVISAGGFNLSLTPGNLFSAGSLSGFMATTCAVGGPPLALIFQRERGTRLRGNLAGIFLIGTVLSIASLIVIKRFGFTELYLALALLPGILLGFILSNRTSKILDKGFIRPAVLVVATLSAGVVIARNLM